MKRIGFPLTIGLAGYAQAGKDTAADGLASEGWRHVSFAEPMRRIASAINPIVDYGDHGEIRYNKAIDLFGYERAKQLFPEMRRFLQRFGTDGMRAEFGEDVWINHAFSLIGNRERVIISDVRFPNEADAIRERDGEVYRIVRPSQEGKTHAHASEHALDGYEYDAVLYNDGTERDIQNAVRAAAWGSSETV